MAPVIASAERCHHVVAPKGDLRWRRDLAQLRRDIMSDHSIRVLEERGQRLRRATPDKVS
jgi:hypothetical protein